MKKRPESRGPEATQFKKGQSGNPGGKPKKIAELQRGLLELAPNALEALRHYVVGPTKEEMESSSPMWFQAMAKERMAALKLWFEFSVPKPKHGDEYDKPLPSLVDPARITTLGLLSDVRTVLACEIARLKHYSDAGQPLSETASARLTECVRQLSVLAEEERKTLDADPFAGMTDDELAARAANAN